MLTVGLCTESLIFFFSAFEKPHEEPDWTLVYPELAGMPDDEIDDEHKLKGTVTEELDNMLEEAKIGPELIESLGTGLRSLNDTTAQLNDVSDAAIATNSFTENMNSASESVQSLKGSYEKASESIAQSADEFAGKYKEAAETISGSASGVSDKLSQSAEEIAGKYKEAAETISGSASGVSEKLSQSAENASDALAQSVQSASESVAQSAQNLSSSYNKVAEEVGQLNVPSEPNQQYNEQLQKVSENLAELNTIYQLQMESSKQFSETSKQMYAGIAEVMENLGASIDDTRRYRDEVARLSENLSQLNTVYGNMLNAMSIGRHEPVG